MPRLNTKISDQPHRIIHGNCLDYLARLPKNSVDLIFADPPYNLQLKDSLHRPDGSHVNAVTDYWDQFSSFKAYDSFTRKWLRSCRRVLKDDGALWVIGSYHNIYRVGSILQDLGYWILNDVAWVKHNPMPNFRGRRLTNAHETLLWCAKSPKSKYTFNYQAMKALSDGRQMRSDWYLPICSGQERIKNAAGDKVHPTQKPEALIKRILLACSQQDDLVLDPFAGSGTTIAVAKSLQRRAIGIERDEEYVKHARSRVTRMPVHDARFLDTIKPPDHRSRIPFGHLVETGMLAPGTRLESPDKRFFAEVTSEGMLKSGDQQGSIHGLGAALNKAPSCNGWTYWHVVGADQQRIPIDAFRQYIQKQREAPGDAQSLQLPSPFCTPRNTMSSPSGAEIPK